MIIIVYGLKDPDKSYISKTQKEIMRALVYDEYTTDDDFSKILKIKNIPIPEPRSNEVVFKVISAGCNYDDIWGMRGKPLAIPLPHISGTDAAGIVTAIIDDITAATVPIITSPTFGIDRSFG